MQGSNTESSRITTTSPGHDVACLEQSARLMTVHEAAAISAGIYSIANSCCNEGYVTVEQMERISHLARQLCRSLDQLGLGLSSAFTN